LQLVLEKLDWKVPVYGAFGYGLKALIDSIRGKRKRSAEMANEWRRVVTCQFCEHQVPRWFLLELGSRRGPVEHLPVPIDCRHCGSPYGVQPPYPEAGQTEAEYEKSDAVHEWHDYARGIDESQRQAAEKPMLQDKRDRSG
jgi:hypothetical protein